MLTPVNTCLQTLTTKVTTIGLLYTEKYHAIKQRLLNTYQLPTMGENTTKSIGARVPMAEYVKIVATAANQKMSVADLTLLKLYADPDPSAQPLQQANQQIQQLNQQIAALETKNDQLAKGIRNWMDEAEMLKFDYDNLSKEQNQERRQIKLLGQELAQLKAQSTH